MAMSNLNKTNNLLGQKLLALALFLPLAWFANSEIVVTAYIVLGQAHFGLTYLYQARAGKLKLSPLLCTSYLAILLGLFWLVFHYKVAMMLIISSLFVVHYYLDEFRLNEEQPSVPRFVLILPLILLIALAMKTHEAISSQFYGANFFKLMPGAWSQGGGHAPEAIAYFDSMDAQTALSGYWPWL